MTRRVVITGMGIVSPVGTGIEYAWENVLAGRSGITALPEEFAEMPVRIGGMVRRGDAPGEFNPDTIMTPREQSRLAKFIVFAMAATDQALRDALGENLGGDNSDPSVISNLSSLGDFGRIGVNIGSGIGGLDNIYETSVELANNGPRHVSPFFIPSAIINMASGNVSIKYGFRGPNLAMATACATGTHAIGESAKIIARGDADVMVTGGAEAALCKLGIAGFAAMRALSTRNDEPARASRPWDSARDGFVMGEGAGILVLEEYEHARARGARIYAEVVGYGTSADAHHITAPAPHGAGGLAAMQAAVSDAGISPQEIDYINAHGTSTPLGDIGELEAVKELLAGANDASRAPSMSSTKSMTGHCLGAAGAIEAIFCALAIRDQIVPPTINLDNPDDAALDFDLVPNVAKKRPVNIAMSNSFGFGGTNATIVLKKI